VPIPNAERAIVAIEKLTSYLLNPGHKRGGAKAKLLLSLVTERKHLNISKPIFGRSICPRM
jgi:hypothetical protein